MKNITLPTTFFTDLMLLAPETQAYVLTICRQLAACDEDTIDQFQLSDGAPAILADFVKRLKRRVRAARRRRQRAASQPKALKKHEPATSAAKPSDTIAPYKYEPRDIYEAAKMIENAACYIIPMATYVEPRRLVSIQHTINKIISAIDIPCYCYKSKHGYHVY